MPCSSMRRQGSGAAPGSRRNLVVRATALYNGKPLTQEVKFNLNVVK